MRIDIDGKEITGYPGQTILDAARANGIDIPTLCYDERVKIYGGCGLCVVEIEGSSKLFRACATPISPGMVVFTNTPRIRESRKLTLELLLSDHIGDCKGPCSLACPAQTDVQGYVGLIANGKYKEAVEVIKRKLPIPASIGRVCPHPCEEACRRQLVEEPIAIAQLKYFAADMDLNSNNPYIPEIKPATGKKVAIIGAGPAGLTAGYYLAAEGHDVTIYDAMPQAGGMLRYGIPEYRLPKSILQKEIDLIQKMGVNFVFNTKIGVDVSFDCIRTQNDAVFIGIGAWESSPLRCTGEDLPGVIGGIDFLRETATLGNVKIGNSVAVVGGGNTAMDAARTAIRLGAEKVTVLYRRTRSEMPAEDIEIKEAEEEGVDFKFLVAPLEITAKDGKANAIRVQQMKLGEPDASGRRSPIPIDGAEEIISVDTIISAIGQKVKPLGFEKAGISKWGTIAADDNTLVTHLPGVFAGGDGVTGPQIAIDAIAQGRKAADAMIQFLNGETVKFKEPYLVEQKNLTPQDFAEYEKCSRVEMPHLAPSERRNNFQEVNLGLSSREAEAEASRCLECGCKDFYECKLIKYANQYHVEPERIEGSKREEKLQETHPFIERNSEKCILCGLCLRICDEVMGVTALGLVHRGFESIVQPEFNIPLMNTDCISCGQCIAVCPTGALTERLPLRKQLPLEMKKHTSVCSFCSLGCEQITSMCGNTVLRVLPQAGEVLCSKGRFGLAVYNNDRVTHPMVRRNGMLIKTTWQEAFDQAARATQKITACNGSNCLALFVSPSYSLEEAGAALELGRKKLETNWFSSFTPNSFAPLAKVLGSNALTADINEIDNTDLILMVGSFNESQITAVKIRKAVGKGAQLVIIANEPTLVDNIAELKINTENNTNILKQIVAAVINNDLTRDEFIKTNIITANYETFKSALTAIKPGNQAEMIADVFSRAPKAMIITDGSTVTAAGIELLADLALITGKVGSATSGVIVVTPGSNQVGLWNLEATADTKELTEQIKSGSIKGIFIMGEDPVGAGLLADEDLSRAEFKVVITPFMTRTAELADVVLPGSAPMETGGTYINANGAVKKLSPITEPAADLNNLDVIQGLADAMRLRISLNNKERCRAANCTPPKIKMNIVWPEDDNLFTPAVNCNPALIKFSQKI